MQPDRRLQLRQSWEFSVASLKVWQNTKKLTKTGWHQLPCLQVVLPQVQVDTGVTWTWLENKPTWSNLHCQVMHWCGLQVIGRNFRTHLNLLYLVTYMQNSFCLFAGMSLPPCICPALNGPSGCTCSWSQVPWQWPGHPYSGLSTLFANPSMTSPSPFTFSPFPSNFHHATHELNEFHDPHNLHGTYGYPSVQHSLFLQMLYNNPHLLNPTSQIHPYQPPPNAAPPAMQGNPSPSKHWKCKNNAIGQGGAGCKCQWQPASKVGVT